MTHNPVLIVEVLDALSPQAGAVYLDATFGRGGYSRAILEAAPCRVIAIDRDPDAIAAAAAKDMKDEFKDRLTLIHGRFSELHEILSSLQLPAVNGIVFDFGVSSPQLDNADRGFSFRQEGPLDMRMEKSGMRAGDFINTASEQEIANVLWLYGEERASRRIARAIIAARKIAPIETTLALADIIRTALPRPKHKGIDPATRSFQAIRIYINDELGEIKSALPAATACLCAGGRLVVVSFHSLEDRLAKTFLRTQAALNPRPSRHLPDVPPDASGGAPALTLIHRKAITASDAEIASNPRARSARLRAAIRTDAPPLLDPWLDEVA